VLLVVERGSWLIGSSTQTHQTESSNL
jgi:hypothetical protein